MKYLHEIDLDLTTVVERRGEGRPSVYVDIYAPSESLCLQAIEEQDKLWSSTHNITVTSQPVDFKSHWSARLRRERVS